MSTNANLTAVPLPDGGQHVFTHRSVMRRNKPRRAAFQLPAKLPEIPLPIDWSKGGAVGFPMLGNDRRGDCMYVAAVHMDQAWTANVGVESTWDEATVIRYYERLSGGDRGLDEGQIVGEWHKGLCGNPAASIMDSLDITDITDDKLTNAAVYFFGGVFFMLSVPNRWINTGDGAAWDAPASPNPNNGHGVMWAGVDEQDRKQVKTWGGTRWLTPAGIPCCDPEGFVVFTNRWFDPKTGLAPNGLSYDQLAWLWTACGGKAPPTNPFPSPLPPEIPA